MAYRDRKSTQIKGALLLALLRLTYWLPQSVSRYISWFFSYFNYLINGKATKIVRKNLQIAYPELSQVEINQHIRDFLRQNAYLTHEIATAWLGEKSNIASKMTRVVNQSLIDDVIAQDKPLIIAVLHLGNWEFCWHWIQMTYPAFGMYQPAKFKQIDRYVLQAREMFGGQAFATDPKGIMGLLKALKKREGIMTILPDQAPREGAGIYTPFFNHPAYTMTLLHKFLQKSQARLLFANCIRLPDGKSFEVQIEAPDFDYTNSEVEFFNQQLNLQIESIIKQNPAQYQWSYKRFKRQPEGQNPYQSL